MGIPHTSKPIDLTDSPGGGRIPEYVAQSLMAILAFDANPIGLDLLGRTIKRQEV